jgi:hypothetical protein
MCINPPRGNASRARAVNSRSAGSGGNRHTGGAITPVTRAGRLLSKINDHRGDRDKLKLRRELTERGEWFLREEIITSTSEDARLQRYHDE